MDDQSQQNSWDGETSEGEPHRVADRYRIVRALGAGGMGEVYLARDETLNREVAVKTIRADLCANERVCRRIRRECLLHARSGTHPHVVTLYDIVESEDRLHLVMEYARGLTLEKMLKASPKGMAWADIRRIVLQCLDALHHIHANGIVHRDIKPSNIIVINEHGRLRAKLMDFGIARFEDSRLEDVSRLTSAVAMCPGTPAYMAPEQIDSQIYGSASAATDVYAMGVVLYQCVGGRPPFIGSLTEIFNGHLNCPPPELDTVTGARVPAGLQTVLAKALAKQPGDRYATASDFRRAIAEDVDRALQPAPAGKAAGGPPDPFPEAPVGAIRSVQVDDGRRRRLFSGARLRWGIAAAAVVLATAGFGMVRGIGPDVPAASSENASSAMPAPSPEPAGQIEEKEDPGPADGPDIERPVAEIAPPATVDGPETDAVKSDRPAPDQHTGPIPESHTVLPGETLSIIASYYGLDHTSLGRWNGIRNARRLAAGTELRLAPPEGGQNGNADVPPVVMKHEPAADPAGTEPADRKGRVGTFLREILNQALPDRADDGGDESRSRGDSDDNSGLAD